MSPLLWQRRLAVWQRSWATSGWPVSSQSTETGQQHAGNTLFFFFFSIFLDRGYSNRCFSFQTLWDSQLACTITRSGVSELQPVLFETDPDSSKEEELIVPNNASHGFPSIFHEPQSLRNLFLGDYSNNSDLCWFPLTHAKKKIFLKKKTSSFLMNIKLFACLLLKFSKSKQIFNDLSRSESKLSAAHQRIQIGPLNRSLSRTCLHSGDTLPVCVAICGTSQRCDCECQQYLFKMQHWLISTPNASPRSLEKKKGKNDVLFS